MKCITKSTALKSHGRGGGSTEFDDLANKTLVIQAMHDRCRTWQLPVVPKNTVPALDGGHVENNALELFPQSASDGVLRWIVGCVGNIVMLLPGHYETAGVAASQACGARSSRQEVGVSSALDIRTDCSSCTENPFSSPRQPSEPHETLMNRVVCYEMDNCYGKAVDG